MEEKRVCIITGANSGIGKEAVQQIGRAGHHVIMACRSVERGESALAGLQPRAPDLSAEVMQVDLGLQASVRAFATAVKSRFPRVDVLIHNAAVFDVSQNERRLTDEGIETTWSTNHLGPVLLTGLLLEPLMASQDGRVITISSQGLVAMPRLRVALDDPEFEKRPFSVTKAYYQSKRAQVMYTRWLARRLMGTPVTANCIRVTAVKVDLERHAGLSPFKRWVYSIKARMAFEPAEMAQTYTWLATSPDLAGVSGRYFNEKQREVHDVPYSEDASNIDAVMALSARYVPELKEVLHSGSKATH